MAQFFLGAVKTDQNPAFVEVRGLGGSPCINQHCRCFDTVGFHTNTVNPVPEAGKHLAANFPAIKLYCWIGGGCTGLGRAKCVDERTGHQSRMQQATEADKVTKYAAFLRGINVGGHRKITMADLRALCMQVTSDPHPRSYIASGNLVFEAGAGKTDIARRMQGRIKDVFGFDVPVLLFTKDEIHAVLASCPCPDAQGDRAHAYLCFDAPHLDLAGVAALRGPTEAVTVVGRTIWLEAPDGVGGSRLAAKLERLIGVQTTARNLNTVRKIAAMTAQ